MDALHEKRNLDELELLQFALNSAPPGKERELSRREEQDPDFARLVARTRARASASFVPELAPRVMAEIGEQGTDPKDFLLPRFKIYTAMYLQLERKGVSRRHIEMFCHYLGALTPEHRMDKSMDVHEEGLEYLVLEGFCKDREQALALVRRVRKKIR